MSTSRPEALGAIALLDEPVRRALYEWVVAQPQPVGRDQAAAALGITRALAAFHLDRLARAGLLETEFRRLTGRSGPGAGRPAKLYRRSAHEVDVTLPARRYGLAAELFARALERGAADVGTVTAVAREAGVALARGHRRAGKAGALEVLSDGGYEPVVDADGTIRLRNCPFHALASMHRGLTCGMNLSLAEGFLEGVGSPGLTAELDPQPGWCCVVLRDQTAAGSVEGDSGQSAARSSAPGSTTPP
ncbi:MAG: helix-turn-helix domain-containing protein [Chloroflexota bacterium]|nr:helix-turn-helix domain-containing protein [Chloroflexota bacterium]